MTPVYIPDPKPISYEWAAAFCLMFEICATLGLANTEGLIGLIWFFPMFLPGLLILNICRDADKKYTEELENETDEGEKTMQMPGNEDQGTGSEGPGQEEAPA